MPRILLTSLLLLAAATVTSMSAMRILNGLSLPADSVQIGWALAAYLYLISLTQQVLKEATDLLGHQSLSAIMVGKVAKRIDVIRSVCYGMHVYFFLAALTGLGATFAVKQMGIKVETMVGIIVGAAAVSASAMVWLLARQQEIFRFRAKLERQKRDDDRRDRQLKDIADKNEPSKDRDPPSVMRMSSVEPSGIGGRA